jgi:hypothetical protein
MRRTPWQQKVAFVFLLLAMTACTPVQPWERGVLAKPQMALTPNTGNNGLVSHVYGSREAAPASSGDAGGGGCGCY